SDARKLARSTSPCPTTAGGRSLVWVKDNGVIAGVRSEEDLYMIEQAATMYCQPEVEVEFSAIKAGGGLVVYVATIPRAERRPIRVIEQDRRLMAYFRVADENIVAHPLMVQAWIYRDSNLMSMSIGREECAILDFLRTRHPDSFNELEIAVECHLSLATARKIISRLAAMELIDFVYLNQEFKITIALQQC
ncbi:MAG: ATP-binding protein, partial [Muribaculaceae bacterium]|nr:ATP-binding protein [Muribaculaceae bacterium]